jgi:membrane protein implicated in regulation of membrane protease activity
MPPQQPPLTSSPAAGVQIVTLTVFSSGSSTPSSLPALSAGGGTSVPIAAIVGGVVGGMVMAVFLVIIWKHWGRKIKRTERQRRKEAVRSLILSPIVKGWFR